MSTSKQDKVAAAGQADPSAGVDARGETHTAPLPQPARGRRINQKALVILAAALAVSALVVWMFITSARQKEAYANRELIRARAAAEQGNLPLAASELQKLIDTYGGTDAAMNAEISLNQVRLINGQTDLAVVGLRNFLAKNPPPKFVTPAQGMLGSGLETAGQPAEAAKAYEQASAATEIAYLKAEYLVDAGRAYRNAGKPDQARQAYATVLAKFGDTPSKTEATVRLAEMTKGQMANGSAKPGS